MYEYYHLSLHITPLFPTSEEKKINKTYFQRDCAVTTQIQFTCLERFRRQILRRKFSTRTPKGTRSVKISTKGICISVWWDAKAFPVSQKLILYRRTNIALKLVLESLTWLTTRNFRTSFPLIFACTLLSDEEEAIRISQRWVNASLFWFVYTIPL